MTPEPFGAPADVRDRPVDAAALIGLDPALDIFLAAGDQRVDQAGKLACGCGDRDRCVLSGEAPTVPGTDECLALPGRHGSHAQGLRDLFDHLGRASR